ncbi:MAG: LTA synthase family protein [Rubrobacter sp.]|nr:LTA synthase family protein [Rubrobacter sp.]
MSSGGENRSAVRRTLLDGWEWVYLLSILLPLFVYNLSLKALRIFSLEESHGLLWHLSLMRSELLFNAGYAILCIGLFAVARRGVLRAASLVALHVTAIAVVAITTSSYQYYGTTGSSLDYGIVTYYFATPGEAQGAISSEMATSAWLVLALGLFYALAGPHLVTRAAERLGLISGSAPQEGAAASQPPAPASSRQETAEQASDGGEAGEAEEPAGGGMTRRKLSRKEFLAVGAGAGAGVFLLRESLLPSTATGASGGVSRSPVSNLIATRAEAARMQAAAEGVEVTNTLAGVRLSPTAMTRPRHVALIHLESVRERSVTVYDGGMRTTPYLDDLAGRSLVVERAYTTQPHTTNAITSVNAGMYPYPGTDIVESQPGGVPARCLPDLLREQGYRTAWFQSAVGGFEDRAQLVENFGYDHFQAIEEMDTEGFQMSNYLGYEDDIMLAPSRRWLEKDLDTPSLITYLGVTPHHDYQVPDRYGRKDFDDDDQLDRYLNNVRYDDFWVQNIIEQYKELGIYEDTIFVIYGDHGEGFGEHGRYQHDGVIWEEGARVPLLIHDPLRYGGERVKGPANLMDIPPTIAEMLGYRVVDGEYPGNSLLNLPSDRTLYISCRPDLLSMASIKGYEKFIYHFGKQPDELFDLRRDPLEKRNLAKRKSEGELEQMRTELLEWHARTGALYTRSGSRSS